MSTNNLLSIAPVVSVLGHVDHGKTTLLDTIRKSSIAAREHGGITQKIGASKIEVMHDGKNRKITFIDTPGHEAFSNMRSRGAQAADIVLLIISSVDGVMPQTKESIKFIKKDKIPYIVVLTKSDSPEKNSAKVKQQLMTEEILLEEYGGDVPLVEVSAKTGDNISKLLDTILLLFDVKKQEKDLNENSLFSGIIIESLLDSKTGPKATLVVKSGKLSVKDEVFAENIKGKVRSLIDSNGIHLESVIIGDAVEVLGFEKVPVVGSVVYKSKDKNNTESKLNSNEEKQTKITPSLEKKQLSLILVADTFGSLEAIVNSLPGEVNLITQKTGEVSEADVMHAKSTGAIILSFNIKIRPTVIKFAITEKILLKNYTIIYEILEEIGQVIEGKIIAAMEQIFGTATIKAKFPFDKETVLGVVVLDGRVAKGDKVRIVRNDEIIGESNLISLRQGKNSLSKIEKGQECGIIISPELDITIGDMVVCHS